MSCKGGKRRQVGERLRKMVLRCELRRSREKRGLSTDLKDLIRCYEKLSPQYAKKLRDVLFSDREAESHDLQRQKAK